MLNKFKNSVFNFESDVLYLRNLYDFKQKPNIISATIDLYLKYK